MKYIGVSTPAYSIPRTGKPSLEKYRKATVDCPLTDLRHLKAVDSHNVKAPEFSVGKGKRSNFITRNRWVPGVGAYDIDRSASVKPRSTNHKAKRETPKDAAVPGVGTYDIEGDMSFGMSRTFGYRFEGAFTFNKTPGPGQYDITHKDIATDQRSRKEQFMRRQILRQERENKPISRKQEEANSHTLYYLPDSLDELRKTSSKLGTLSISTSVKAKRGKSVRALSKTTPGPGEYDVPVDLIKDSMTRGDGFTAAGKSKNYRSTSFDTPGPGQYRMKSHALSSRTYSIGKAKKDLAYLLRGITPGPGEYENIDIKTSRSVGMTKSTRKAGNQDKSEHQNVPGPGAYDTRTKVGEGPKFSLTFKKRAQRMYTDYSYEESLGPGRYSPLFTQTREDPKSQTFTKSIRPTSRKLKRPTPGVGDYNVDFDGNTTARTGLSFTTAPRNLMPDGTIEVFPEPGPGAYNLKHTIPQLQKFEQDRMDIEGWKISL